MPNETNVFRPALVAQGLTTSAVPDPVTETQYAQERFLSAATQRSNPGFALTNTINRLADNMGGILRGYIRRANIDPADDTSAYRLYFMYNPESIQRSYISYLDQQALDPGNALFGSNNMSAAPALLDFTFDLLFDRQIEVAQDPDHPGTKVDYDYFDLVVRGIVPDSSANGNAIPDNGILMVNPHSIVVVFGEDLSVQGRVTNASVSFDKFNNRMIPTRLSIGISMKAFYIGTVQTIPNYSLFTSQSTAGATIPYENSAPVQLDAQNVKFIKTELSKGSISSAFISSNLIPQYSIPVIGSADENEFAKDLLIALADPVTEANMLFVLAWERAEGGIDHNNPLNTTQQMPGSSDFNSVGVQTYVSIQQGLDATVQTITNGLYDNILAAMKDGTSACASAAALAASPWGTGTLVQQILGC